MNLMNWERRNKTSNYQTNWHQTGKKHDQVEVQDQELAIGFQGEEEVIWDSGNTETDRT